MRLKGRFGVAYHWIVVTGTDGQGVIFHDPWRGRNMRKTFVDWITAAGDGVNDGVAATTDQPPELGLARVGLCPARKRQRRRAIRLVVVIGTRHDRSRALGSRQHAGALTAEPGRTEGGASIEIAN